MHTQLTLKFFLKQLKNMKYIYTSQVTSFKLFSLKPLDIPVLF